MQGLEASSTNYAKNLIGIDNNYGNKPRILSMRTIKNDEKVKILGL